MKSNDKVVKRLDVGSWMWKSNDRDYEKLNMRVRYMKESNDRSIEKLDIKLRYRIK